MNLDKLVDAFVGVLNTIARRMTETEADMADSAQSQEALANAMQAVSEKVDKLTTMSLEQAEQADRIEAMLSNYIEATRDMRTEARKAIGDAKMLHSEVREKLKACPGG